MVDAEWLAEMKLEAALDAVIGHACVGVKVIRLDSLKPGSYMYDDRKPLEVYAATDVFDRLRELLPNGVG